MSYLALFLAALCAATILPMQSEAVLTGLLLAGGSSPAALVAVASAGNVLGSVINWALGRGISRFQDRKWFPASPEQLARARDFYLRYGRWSLLLSWVPVIGDPLTVMAGVLREKLWVFALIVGFAKTARYIALAWAVLGVAG